MNNESLAHTIAPNSNQANADDLIASPVTVKILAVKQGDKESPVWITTTGFDGRAWKPCKSMRRVLISAWGEYPAPWIGRSVTLFCDPEVVYGGVKVGGIRISHMSDIDADMQLSLTATRGKRKAYTVRKLAPAVTAPETPYPADKFAADLPKMRESLATGKSSVERILTYCATIGTLTAEQIEAIKAPIKTETEEETF